MSSPEQDPTGPPPTEEELRAAYEAELSRITAGDMIAQATVSLLNIGAYRLGPPAGVTEGPEAGMRDLEQARDAIDAAGALLKVLERRIPGELGPLRDALSRLQMAYAQEAQGPAPDASVPGAPAPEASAESPASEEAPQGPPEDKGPGPAQSSGRLWVPGS
jgi:hypothetical protein